MNQLVKYRIEAFREFVPHPLRFIIFLLTSIIFQFPNSVYLINISEIMGAKSITLEDARMASTAVLIGMMIAFPILYRIKFRFTTRTIILTSATVVAIGNIVCLYSDSMLVLIPMSMIIGFFRMIGNFECLSNIRLIITPKRDFTRYYLVIYSMVLTCIHFSSIFNAYISDMFGWKYMYVVVISSQLFVMIVIFSLLRPIRLNRKMPLYQIDWIGGALWAILLFLVMFVAEYGKKLDWFASAYIIQATCAAVVVLILTIHRMFTIRRPYIMPEVFKYKNLMHAMMLFVAMHILLTTTSIIMTSYTENILHYDHIQSSSLNWIAIIGVGIAIAFTYYWKIIYNGGFKRIIFLGFLALVMNHVILYFIFQPSIAKESLYLPYILRGFGYMTLYLNLTLYAVAGLPFSSFFSSLCVLGFVRTILGGNLTYNAFSNILQYLQRQNMMRLSANIDYTNIDSNAIYTSVFNQSISTGQSVEQAMSTAMNSLYSNIYTQATLLSWKDLFGSVILFGIIVLLIIILQNYRVQLNQQYPKMKNILKTYRIRD